jgi:hypothetical protein
MDSDQWIVYLGSLLSNLTIQSSSSQLSNTSSRSHFAELYDFPSFVYVLDSLSSFITSYRSASVASSESWVEFLALNPSVVFEQGFADAEQAKQILSSESSQAIFPLLTKKSLDLGFFRDKNPGLEVTLSKPPYAKYGGKGAHPPILYNRLQWVSAPSLLLVWDFLARRLPEYTRWYKSQPLMGEYHSAALLIDPRYSPETFAVAMNIMYNLGPGWDLYIHCSSGCNKLKEEFKGFRVTFMVIEDLNLTSAYKVSKWLMNIDLWKSLTEEVVLVFQVDSILLKQFVINDFVSLGFPFIGGYAPGVGSDMRTPKGVGMNGGLSLRSPEAMCKCLEQITPEMVNAYRASNGLEVLPYNPQKGIYYMEDVYFYHALEMLQYSLPSIEVQNRFSVQSSFYREPLGIHGYDKGWYLTTAQLLFLLNESHTMPMDHSNRSRSALSL